MNNHRLSLDVIDVAEPCSQPWDRMSGDDRVRYCDGCRKHVYNLSAMTRTEAERVVCDAAGSLCVRFARSETGGVRTLEYQAPAGPKRGWRFWTAVSTCAASVVAGVHGYFLAPDAPVPPAALVVVGKPVTRVTPQPAMVLGLLAMPPAPAPAADPPPPLPATDPADLAAR